MRPTAGPSPVVIAALASAFPPVVEQDELWSGFFAARPGASRLGEAAFRAAGVKTRHAAFDPRAVDVSSWSTGRRMDAYLDAALPLGVEAANAALAGSGRGAAEIGLLVVVSCTGHGAPGLDIHLARALGLPADARRLLVGHVGCHAALPALQSAADDVALRRRPALVVCAELSSLHLQPPPDTAQQAISHALFADAAAALVLDVAAGEGDRRLSVVDHEARSDLDTAAAITWEVTDQGFVMGLSRQLPRLVHRLAGPVVDRLLERNDVKRGDVAGWAIHPGGPRLLTSVGSALDLDATALGASAQVLASRGNCSSATVLLVLEALTRPTSRTGAGPVVLLAFGPGVTAYASLLRTTDRA